MPEALPHHGGTPSLCLCMMVCNEAKVIGRALRSVRDHIDYWVICDNGSTDATVPEIFNTLSGIPGQLHRTTWVNFGHNRERTLRLAQGKGDYLLIMDADMILNVHGPFKHKLADDAYLIRYEGACDYGQSLLVAGRLPWRYVGVTHEYITAPEAAQAVPLKEVTLTHLADGGMRGRKFERDEELLRRSVEADPSNARDTFYLAQTYFDTGRYAEALKVYRQRAALAGWDEETWYSLHRIGECTDLLGEEPETVLAAFAEAFAARPTRLEPLHRIVQKLREMNDAERAFQAAALSVALPYPDDMLFIDRAVHEYAFLLEFAACALEVQRAEEANAALGRVLRVPTLPSWAYEEAVSLLRGEKADTAEFFTFAAVLEHDLEELKRDEEQETFCRSPDIDSLRVMGSHATPEQKARRKQTFFHPAIASRRQLGQGRHDAEEAIAFAGVDRDPNDQRTFGLHLPLHAKKHSVRHKVVGEGQRWDVSLRGDRWGLHPMEDVYVLLNVETLVLERDAELVVQGNVLSLLCQRIICAPGSRIALLPTPFSVDSRGGPHDGERGMAGFRGTAGADGTRLRLGGSILGPCLLPDEISEDAVTALHGGAGTVGTNGGRGGQGRNGGMCKLAELTFREVFGELTVFAQPGAGGNGGAGGPGGSGGAGGHGADGHALLTGTIAAGRGGAGGEGGDGGRGGHGGHGGLSSNVYVSVPAEQVKQIRCVSLPGLPGRAGAGGTGGAGGAGGEGGREPRRDARAPSGADGHAGVSGRSGLEGRPRPAPWIFVNEDVVCGNN